MIIFNNAGHSFVSAPVSEDPIVWVDASDISTYTLSGNDVLTLDNKGTLGGAMTLNGSVKFANNGFESWSNSDYITRDLGEPFLTDSSFTMVTAFDFQNIAQNLNRGWWGSLYANNNNRIIHNRDNANIQSTSISSSNVNINAISYELGVAILIASYNLDTNVMQLLNFDGSNLILNSISFNNSNNAKAYLLRSGASTTTSAGANNPLHEFRLYNRAMSLTEMQDLQTELNNKYSKPIVWVDSSDISTYTLSGNDVLTLDNKGSLGGVMTLNGGVKFANGGFESWSNNDYITRDLGEPFLTDSSFTIVTTFDFQNIAQNLNRGWWGSLYGDINNRVSHFRLNSNMFNQSVSSSTFNQNSVSYQLGLQTLVSSYDLDTNNLITINFDGTTDTLTSITYNNLDNALIWLLKAGTGAGGVNSEANNPLHEFRLYDRAFDLTEMQDLQTELNNKYSKPIVWVN